MSTNENKPIFKGDNTGAFGNTYITITKTFTDENNFTSEEIELTVNFDSCETSKLVARNVGNLIVYDMQHRQCTCSQSMTFTAQNGVICKQCNKI